MAAVSLSLLGLVLAGACVPEGSRAPALASVGAQNPAEPDVAASASAHSLVAVRARELVVTSGSIELESGPLPRKNSSLAESFRVSSPVLRAWVGQQPRSAVELEFTYLGPTPSDAPLASGERRRQIGVELRAHDSCNLVYVMWRIEPVQQLVVSLKQNPGQHQHRECGDHGYVTLYSSSLDSNTVDSNTLDSNTESLPLLRLGERHVLRAALSGLALEVQVDGRRHWQGSLPPGAAALQGPVGLRADNGQFEVRLRAGSPSP
jgi:hypothetical protein